MNKAYRDLFSAIFFSDEDRVVDFVTSAHTRKVFMKFKKRLNSRLNEMKKRDADLADVKFDFSGFEQMDDEGITVMSVWKMPPYKTICVNMLPFVLSLGDDFSDESFEKAYEMYKVDDEGNDIIQHECAHILDAMYRGEDSFGKHDKIFNQMLHGLDK